MEYIWIVIYLPDIDIFLRHIFAILSLFSIILFEQHLCQIEPSLPKTFCFHFDNCLRKIHGHSGTLLAIYTDTDEMSFKVGFCRFNLKCSRTFDIITSTRAVTLWTNGESSWVVFQKEYKLFCVCFNKINKNTRGSLI